jgi:hypothetical protein
MQYMGAAITESFGEKLLTLTQPISGTSSVGLKNLTNASALIWFSEYSRYVRLVSFRILRFPS